MKFPTRIYYTETDKALMWDRAHRPKTCKLVGDPVLGRVVAKKLKQFWSPEQIAGWLKYTYIDGRETPELIWAYCRRCRDSVGLRPDPVCFRRCADAPRKSRHIENGDYLAWQNNPAF